jgi:type IV pilus assembly protein PilX
MKPIVQHSSREGFVIVITLVLLLVMTTMGIGLFYETKKTANQVRSNNNNSETLYSAESCIAEAKRWLNTVIESDMVPCIDDAEGSVCQVIGEKYMGDPPIRIDPSVSSDSRLSAHYYRCEITRLSTVSTEIRSSGSGDGEERYDESDDIGTIISSTSTSYYKIRSKACVSTSDSCTSDNPNITIIEEIVKIN